MGEQPTGDDQDLVHKHKNTKQISQKAQAIILNHFNQ